MHIALRLFASLFLVFPAFLAAQSGAGLLKVASVLDLESAGLNFLDPVSLSPDGRQIAVLAQDSLVVYDVGSSLTQRLTIPLSFSADPNSIRWSPDSKKITLTENFFMLYRESDIWVADVRTGKLQDVTDDKVNGYQPGQVEPGTRIDTVPCFSPDSGKIAFCRYVQDTAPSVPRLCILDLNSGKVTDLGEVGPAGVWVLAIAWSPDASTLSWVSDPAAKTTLSGAVSACDIRGGNQRVLCRYAELATACGVDTAGGRTPYLPSDLSFSPDGRSILCFGQVNGFMSGGSFATSVVIAADGSGVGPVDSKRQAHFAAWASAGNALIYVVVGAVSGDSEGADSGVFTVDGPGRLGSQIYKGSFRQPGFRAKWRSGLWSRDGSYLSLMRTEEGDPKLLLLRVK